MSTVENRGSQKLRRFILLHFGLVTFRIRFGEIRTPFIFMVFGLGGRDHDSRKTNYFQFWKHRDTSNNARNHHYWTYCFRKCPHFENRYLKMLENGDRTILKPRLIHSWESWIWDQYLLKDMKFFRLMGHRHFEFLKLTR